MKGISLDKEKLKQAVYDHHQNLLETRETQKAERLLIHQAEGKAIRDALEAGVSPTELAELLDVSYARIYQLRSR